MSPVASMKSVFHLMLVTFLLLLSKVAATAAVANGDLSTQNQLCKAEGVMERTCRQEMAVRHEGLSDSVPGDTNDERARFAAIEDFDELRKVCDQLADSYTECNKKNLIEITRTDSFNHSSESEAPPHSSQPDKSDLALVLVTVFLVQLGWIATVMRWKQGIHWRNNVETESAPSETVAAAGGNYTDSNATTELSQKKND